jgi:hypothetical protein
MNYQGKTIRQELKYTISYLEYACLRSTLKALLQCDEHTGPTGEYLVSSLYFDNLTDDAWFEKESGYFQRAKYRIRIYDGSDKLIRLELKEKYGNSTSKSGCTISRQIYEDILAGRLRYNQISDNRLLIDFYLKTRLEGLRPKVIVEYLREPFVCISGNVRVTFDKNLRSIINTVDLFSSYQNKASPTGYEDMILEVKYDDFIPAHIKSLLTLRSFRKIAISKYTICRETRNSLDWRELAP